MPLLLAEIDWNALLQQPEPDMLAVLLLVLATVGILGVTGIIAVQWRKAQQTISEARLKERMIERGYTAGEITSVLNAGVGRGRKSVAEDIPESCESVANGRLHTS